MNEIEFLHQQVSLERRHMSEVKNACEAAIEAGFNEDTLNEFCGLCGEYLVFIVDRFNAQDGAHVQLLRPRLGPEEAMFLPVLDDLEAALAANRAAIEQLRVAIEARHSGHSSAADMILAVKNYIDFYNKTLRKQQPALGPLFARHYTLADWRAASIVTADSILEERSRYTAITAALPSGIELKSSGRPG